MAQNAYHNLTVLASIMYENQKMGKEKNKRKRRNEKELILLIRENEEKRREEVRIIMNEVVWVKKRGRNIQIARIYS